MAFISDPNGCPGFHPGSPARKLRKLGCVSIYRKRRKKWTVDQEVSYRELNLLPRYLSLLFYTTFSLISWKQVVEKWDSGILFYPPMTLCRSFPHLHLQLLIYVSLSYLFPLFVYQRCFQSTVHVFDVLNRKCLTRLGPNVFLFTDRKVKKKKR